MLKRFNSFSKAFIIMLLTSTLLAGCKENIGDIFSPNKEEEFNPNNTLNKQSVGASAKDLLSAENFSKVIVEIQYAQGFAPTQTAIDNLRKFMEKYTNKPGGIILKQSNIPAPGKSSYNVYDLVAIEDKYRSEYTRKDTMAVYFFFADSGYSEDTQDSKVLGVAYRNTSMAIFERTVQDYSGGFNQPETSKLETVILNHEFGHILGLVNAGTPMQANHQDAPHGRHCTDTGCLMHWSVETGDVVANLFGSSMPDLDQNCINDLKANGGK
jgi:predicted Zn-dependent protease